MLNFLGDLIGAMDNFLGDCSNFLNDLDGDAVDKFLGEVALAKLTFIEPKSKVKISNKLIDAKCNLDVLQWTLLFALISAMDDTAKTMGFYKVSAAEVAELLRIRGKNRLRVIRDLCSTLVGAKLYLRVGNDAGATYDDELTWFSRLRSIPKNPYILFKMEDDLACLLLNQEKGYVQLQLDNLLKFRRKYTFQIYAICVKNKKFNRQTFCIDDLVEQLDCPKSYLVSGVFEEKVLKPATEEINLQTELQVSYTISKTKKLKLNIKEKDKYASFFESLNPQAQVAYTYFVELKVSKSAIIHCVNTFGQEVFEKIYREIRSKNPNEVKNMAAYAATCLRNGYYTQTPEPIKKIETRLPEPEPLEDEIKQTPEEIEPSEEEKAENAKVSELLDEIRSMTTTEQERLYGEVMQYCHNEGLYHRVIFGKFGAIKCITEDSVATAYATIVMQMKGDGADGETG